VDPNIADPAKKVFMKHGGPIFSIKWLDETRFLSGSGDTKTMLWDITLGGGEVKEPVQTFSGHGSFDRETGKTGSGDVNGIETWGDLNQFLTCSADNSTRMYDLRVRTAEHAGVVATCFGHEAPVNKVVMMQNSNNTAFGTASDDGTVRLWDMRTLKQLNQIGDVDDTNGASSLCFTASGAMTIVGHNNGDLAVHDTITGERLSMAGIPSPADGGDPYFPGKVTCCLPSPDGYAIATCAETDDENKNFALWV